MVTELPVHSRCLLSVFSSVSSCSPLSMQSMRLLTNQSLCWLILLTWRNIGSSHHGIHRHVLLIPYSIKKLIDSHHNESSIEAAPSLTMHLCTRVHDPMHASEYGAHVVIERRPKDFICIYMLIDSQRSDIEPCLMPSRYGVAARRLQTTALTPTDAEAYE
jgi:hypothetical protein